MPLHIGDYLADTGHLGTAQHGAYLLLIMHYWRNGGVPDNDRQLASIARLPLRIWQDIRPIIEAFFQPGWKHKRIDDELRRAQEKYDRRSSAGTEGAKAKWGKTIEGTRSQRLANARKVACHSELEWMAMQAIFGCCVRCGRSNSELEGGICCKDHVKPISAGGSDGIENIQPLCRECNASKGGEVVDYRDKRLAEWRIMISERLAKRLADASEMPENLQPTSHNQEEVKGKEEPRVSALAASGWPPDFREQFWGAYPHKVGKADAIRKLERAAGKVSFDALMAALFRYANKTDDRPWANPATWIHQERWTDQPAMEVPNVRQTPIQPQSDWQRARDDGRRALDEFRSSVKRLDDGGS